MNAFYEPLGDGRYRATAHTAGPWDPAAQHAGPPSALVGGVIERCAPRDDLMVARVTCEILGPVPVGEVSVEARVARPGRSVELIEAVLRADGRDAMLARAWRIRRAEGPSVPSRDPAPPPRVDAPGVPESLRKGYLGALDWRFVRGGFGVPGPAAAWTRLDVAVVAGEEPTPLQRVLAVADSGNGISGELDWNDWWFINTELTLHTYREAVGEWVCLDASTTIAPNGAGLATSTLSDDEGPLGRAGQALLVGPRK
ncbi:MAG: hypothetical protein QOE45_2927 [Frankiaceae bacterium]|nr:hypothetical protein [Frankiaceae bacterium]